MQGVGAAYYNEHDPEAAAWLRELIKAGLIAPGDVDERSIEDVIPSDIAGYTQCHFFAGVGTWSWALRCAGWPDTRQVWTGSCPCQPFSAAGKGDGFDDERHLWPAFFHLIESCRPVPVFGEQVASKDGLAWLDLVADDLEGAGYAVGAVDTCAAGFGAPHIRQRLYWVADAEGVGRQSGQADPGINTFGVGQGRGKPVITPVGGQGTGGLAHPGAPGLPLCECQDLRGEGRREEGRAAQQRGGASGGLDHAQRNGRREVGHHDAEHDGQLAHADGDSGRPRPTDGHWRDADWLLCRDGKWRPVEPAFKQMADGVALVMGYLRDCGTDEKVKEAIDAAANHPYTAEVLREVREGVSTEKIWLKVGGQVGFFAATVLLSFVLQREGKLGHFIYCAEKGSAEECAGLLRGLRGNREDARSPLGPEHPQQFRQQLENAMSSLPQISTLEVLGSMNGSPLAHGAPRRVVRLRGYGNAIVAPQAEAFVRAYMDVRS